MVCMATSLLAYTASALETATLIIKKLDGTQETQIKKLEKIGDYIKRLKIAKEDIKSDIDTISILADEANVKKRYKRILCR